MITQAIARYLAAPLLRVMPAVVLIALFVVEPAHARGSCSTQAVEDVEIFTPDLEAPLSGASVLCVTHRGLRGSMRVNGVTPGYAYTVWWVYIDKPGGCNGFAECLATFFGEDPLAVFGRMDSGVARRSRIWFSDRLDDMQVRSGSQVWMLMFGHLAADDEDLRQRARQLLTPEDPGAGAPHLGVAARGYPAAIAIYEID